MHIYIYIYILIKARNAQDTTETTAMMLSTAAQDQITRPAHKTQSNTTSNTKGDETRRPHYLC